VRVIQTYDCALRHSESLVQITPQVYSCMCFSSQTIRLSNGGQDESWVGFFAIRDAGLL